MDQLIAGRRAWWIIGALAALSAFAGVFTIQPLDRDEARYAQATAQMLESGDFVEINFQDAPRHKKPVGIYWMQAVAVGLLSDADSRQIWAYRLPSVIGAMLAALGCFWAGTRLMSREAAFVAASLFAVSVLLGAEGGIAKTDAMLAGVTTLAMATLVQLRHDGGRQAALIFWVMLALGILVKGPVTPMVAGLTMATLIVWERRMGWLKPLLFWPGPILAALIILPWFVAMELMIEGGFIRAAFIDDLAPKLASGDEGHGAWPGYHLLTLSALTLPFVIFLVPGLWKAASVLRAGESEAARAVRFLIAWIIPSWIVFELMPTKLPHYTLPLYAALALLAGLGWENLRSAPRWSRYASLALGIAGAIALTALIFLAVTRFGGTQVIAWGAAGIFGLLAAGLMVEVFRRRAFSAWALAILTGLGWQIMMRGVAIPSAPDLDLSRRAAHVAEQMIAASGNTPEAILSSYTEPSLVFALGTDTQLLAFDVLASRVSGATGLVLSIEDTARSEADLIALEQIESGVCARQEVSGFNYSRGQETVLIVRLHNCEQGG
ncbi:MAG: phospholipid carrier-dependent glycosyltransferase [Alphaproteobacteria bacterium]|nr:phospholipid carrier-dependent glycosyltransferase [Alphaproteobacteria bacterium]